jgi:NADPH2:quinone reductase
MVLEEFGTPVVLRELDRPVAGVGQVLVRVKAGGVNPLDLKIRDGGAAHARRVLPAVPGLDLAGVVEQVGPGVAEFAPGDEVFGMTGGVGDIQGSLAEYAAVDARLLARKPATLSMREAAALPLVAITAWEGLVDRARVGEGHKVLIHGGAGGIGHVAIQIARSFGAEVFATTARKPDLVESLGATAIDHTTQSMQEYVDRHTGGEGFDVIFDTVGGAVLDASFAAVRTYTGHVVSALGWGTHSIAPLSFRGATYSGVFTLLPLLTGRGREHHGQIMSAVAALAENGRLRPVLDPAEYGLTAVNDAYKAVEDGTAQGKVAVEVEA